MLQAIDKALEFSRGITKEEFSQDGLVYFAIVKNIEIIGEAAYMLTPDFKDQHPLTPWAPIVAMRHFLVHGYYHVDAEEVWNVVMNDLGPLRDQLLSYLEEQN